METTKLIVEYLIIGILISLSIVFLIFNIAPNEVQSVWSTLIQDSSLVSTVMVVMLLPICYGIGIVAEYLGMFLFSRSFDAIKEKRFDSYVTKNLAWLGKSQLLSKFTQKGKSIPIGVSSQIYAEMRFFVLKNDINLYAEIEKQVNRLRILRVLVIVEIIFVTGFVIQLFRKDIDIIGLVVFLVIIVMLIFTIRAVDDRSHRYCRAIEYSFNALSLDEFNIRPSK